MYNFITVFGWVRVVYNLPRQRILACYSNTTHVRERKINTHCSEIEIGDELLNIWLVAATLQRQRVLRNNFYKKKQHIADMSVNCCKKNMNVNPAGLSRLFLWRHAVVYQMSYFPRWLYLPLSGLDHLYTMPNYGPGGKVWLVNQFSIKRFFTNFIRKTLLSQPSHF